MHVLVCSPPCSTMILGLSEPLYTVLPCLEYMNALLLCYRLCWALSFLFPQHCPTKTASRRCVVSLHLQHTALLTSTSLYPVHQHQPPSSQSLAYQGLGTSPSLHQVYSPVLDFTCQLPQKVPRVTMYGGISPEAMAGFQQGVNPSRRKKCSGIVPLSPLLKEFRANKTGKWELKVCHVHVRNCPAVHLLCGI